VLYLVAGIAEMAAPAFLEPLTGIYRYGTVEFRIGIDEAGRLTFTCNEAPTERLLARHDSIFGFADSEAMTGSTSFWQRPPARGTLDFRILHS
jgi:hypothetical protein